MVPWTSFVMTGETLEIRKGEEDQAVAREVAR